jgi:arsenical-resistance protein 2
MSTSQPAEPVAASPPPWHAAYPAPRNPKPDGMTREEVLALLNAQAKDKSSNSPKDFVLVDLRRADHEVC